MGCGHRSMDVGRARLCVELTAVIAWVGQSYHHDLRAGFRREKCHGLQHDGDESRSHTQGTLETRQQRSIALEGTSNKRHDDIDDGRGTTGEALMITTKRKNDSIDQTHNANV